MNINRILTATLALILAGCGDAVDNRPPAGDPPRTQVLDTAADRRARREAEVLRRRQSMPRFEQYPARDTFNGPPVPVDLSSAEMAPHFRTVLRDGAAKGPNFAGHYTVVQWGCGSSCQSFAIVDARTGRVTFGATSLTMGAAYRLGSELFIANPSESWLQEYGADAVDAVGGFASSTYFRWDGRRLIPLDSLPIGHDVDW